MSVYIRGMDMPTSCAKCKLFGEYGCPFIGAVGYALTRGERNEDCPLILVPPHGDLIDRNALPWEKQGMMLTDPDEWGLKAWDIEHAPTIIPADKEAKD